MRIIPGKIQTLPVYDMSEKHYMLGDERYTILLHKREVENELVEGDTVEVFVHYDENGELEATTTMPEIQVGEMICTRANNVNTMGAFIKIGTKRDILIPNKDQRIPIEAGQMILVILRDDPEARRLYGSTRISSNVVNKDMDYERGQEVELTIAEAIDVGRRVVVNGKHFAALFEQEIIRKIRFGDKVKGYIRKVEGKDLVVSLQKEGIELLEDAKVRIMQYLQENNGYARLNDDTDPEEVKLRLHMSKKTFKKAAGMLFKDGKVTLTKLGIKINTSGEIPTEWRNTKIDDGDDTSGEPNKEGKTPVKPRKEFVDKRNYKGNVQDEDRRNDVLKPRERRQRVYNDSGQDVGERRERRVAPSDNGDRPPRRDGERSYNRERRDDDRPREKRYDRSERSDRPERSSRSDRGDRKERPASGDRKFSKERSDKPYRKEGGDRRERPAKGDYKRDGKREYKPSEGNDNRERRTDRAPKEIKPKKVLRRRD